VPDAILSRWETDIARNADFTLRDRSAIYGGVHLYRLRGEGT
jgi:S-adenosylmethionine-diacylglycerol 3-amino-3-carboxypropyl transferase